MPLLLATPRAKTAADCGTNTPLDGPDNYACKAGVCEYKGCNANQECFDTFKTSNWVCALDPEFGYKYCHNTCKSPADCITPGSPVNGADNYTCEAGSCVYKGCKSTQECVDAYQNPNLVCK